MNHDQEPIPDSMLEIVDERINVLNEHLAKAGKILADFLDQLLDDEQWIGVPEDFEAGDGQTKAFGAAWMHVYEAIDQVRLGLRAPFDELLEPGGTDGLG